MRTQTEITVNKYYIGWPLPEAFRKSFIHAQSIISDWLTPETRRLPEEELHITALYLGKMPKQQAMDTLIVMHGNTGCKATLREVEVFTNRKGPHALVVRLKDTDGALLSAHEALMRQSGVTADFAFNPHVTLAKTEGFPDFGMTKAAEVLNLNYPMKGAELVLSQVALYEKVEGSKYEPIYIYG